MSLFSCIRCLCCLVRCSKYLYYIKKIICLTAILLAVVTGIHLLGGSGMLTKKLRELL